jgi:hypothetical protein
MGEGESAIQLDSGAVMGGMFNPKPSPAVFNTGMVLLGWSALYEQTTPCGKGSPFEYFAKHDVKMVFAGADPATLTYFHFVEEVLEPQMPFSPFTAERFSIPYRVNGVVHTTPPIRLYEPSVSRRRTLDPLFQELQRTGKWRTGKTGTLQVVVLRAPEILEAAESLAARKVFCYG